jgi:hypothetical protein
MTLERHDRHSNTFAEKKLRLLAVSRLRCPIKSLKIDDKHALSAIWLSLIYYPILSQTENGVFQDTVRKLNIQ